MRSRGPRNGHLRRSFDQIFGRKARDVLMDILMLSMDGVSVTRKFSRLESKKFKIQRTPVRIEWIARSALRN